MYSRCATPSSCTGDPSSRPSSPLTWWGSDELLLRADDRLRSAAYEACQSSATGERPELGRRSTMLRLRLTAPSPDPLRSATLKPVSYLCSALAQGRWAWSGGS